VTRRTALQCLGAAPVAAAAQTPDAQPFVARLEKNLRENILPFWFPKTLDRENGGYVLNHDIAGAARANGTKGIVTQARQLWFAARVARTGYRADEMLAAAEHGFRFLRDRMWDKQHGGFYWEVDAAGTKVLRPKKHMYGESFGLYALSEYYLASKNEAALELAGHLFELFEKKAHDAEYGGYREYFNQDWSAPPASEESYMQVPGGLKLMNTHLHLLESMTTYVRAARGAAVAKERLAELLHIETNAVVRMEIGACSDKFDRNWKPRMDRGWAVASYGHDLENVWLCVDACKALGVAAHPFVEMFRMLWDYSLKYGYDGANGGFYYTGPYGKPADNRVRSWWVQAEAIVSALYMHKLTGDAKYWQVFAKTCDFIDRHQTDWKRGEWFEGITPDLKPVGAKASIWKGAYHNGRAMIECLELLRG
jgi:mannobiose 2-epimerase